MFGSLKDWRRIATRYDRCLKDFAIAIALAATVLFWLWKLMSPNPNKPSIPKSNPLTPHTKISVPRWDIL